MGYPFFVSIVGALVNRIIRPLKLKGKITLLTYIQSHKISWTIFAGILVLIVILLWLAPNERILGNGIKVVYVHVALIWVGIAGLILVGLLGFWMLITDKSQLQPWTYTIAWVTLTFFAAGIGMSMLAAQINWGGIFLAEPRYTVTLQVLAIGIIFQVINSWDIPQRFKGLLWMLPAAFYVWSVMQVPLVLHPENPARTSTSLAIRFTFLGLFVLFLLAGAWIVFYLQRRVRRAKEEGTY